MTAALSVLVCAAPLGAQSESLESAAGQFADAWSKGSGQSLVRSLSGAGVIVELQGEDHGSLDAARAASAIDRFLGGHVSRAAQVTRASDVGGSPRKGFAEIRWQAVVPGTSELLTYTVFAGFVAEDGEWRVSEVRVLR